MESLRLILDSGALSTIAEGDPKARRFFEKAIKFDIPIVVPSVVLAESTRGTASDAKTNRALKATIVLPVDEKLAREAGALRFAARSDQTLDAVVMATADRCAGSAVLTTDESDMKKLAAIGSTTTVLRV